MASSPNTSFEARGRTVGCVGRPDTKKWSRCVDASAAGWHSSPRSCKAACFDQATQGWSPPTHLQRAAGLMQLQPAQPRLHLCVGADANGSLGAPHRLGHHLVLPACTAGTRACWDGSGESPKAASKRVQPFTTSHAPIQYPRELPTSSCAAGSTHTPLPLLSAPVACLIAAACSACSGSFSALLPATRRPGLIRVSGPAEQASGPDQAVEGKSGGRSGGRKGGGGEQH